MTLLLKTMASSDETMVVFDLFPAAVAACDSLLLAAELVDEHILPVVNFCQRHVQLPVHLVTIMILVMTRSMIQSK